MSQNPTVFMQDKNFSSDFLEVLGHHKGRSFYSTSLLIGDEIFIGDWSGNVICTDLHGKKKWTIQENKKAVNSTFYNYKGKIFFRQFGACLSSIDISTKEWSTKKLLSNSFLGVFHGSFFYYLSSSKKSGKIIKVSLDNFESEEVFQTSLSKEPMNSTIFLINDHDEMVTFVEGHLVFISIHTFEVVKKIPIEKGMKATNAILKENEFAFCTEIFKKEMQKPGQVPGVDNYLDYFDSPCYRYFEGELSQIPILASPRLNCDGQYFSLNGKDYLFYSECIFEIKGEKVLKKIELPARKGFGDSTCSLFQYVNKEVRIFRSITRNFIKKERGHDYDYGWELFTFKGEQEIQKKEEAVLHAKGANFKGVFVDMFQDHLVFRGDKRFLVAKWKR